MARDMSQWFTLSVNPYPWKVPPFTPARSGKKIYVKAGRDQGLHSYKEAIKEQLIAQPHYIIEGPVDLSMWYYRNIPKYTTAQGRTARKHDADTTNLQKASEDALQGILFSNDKDVIRVTSHRVVQSEAQMGILVICAKPFEEVTIDFPTEVQYEVDRINANEPLPKLMNFNNKPEDIPF